ncbi:MAG: PH domain-containing protein [Candidatus Acidiferrales bacterium]
MVYRSKVDAWIALLVGGGALVSVAVGAMLLWQGERLGWLVLLLMPGLLRLLAWPIDYEVADSELVIRAGVLRWRIPIASIVNVEPTRNPLSSPAWSLDRLRVRYRPDRSGRPRIRWIQISPEEKQAFLLELAARDPALQLNGEHLSRTR